MRDENSEHKGTNLIKKKKIQLFEKFDMDTLLEQTAPYPIPLKLCLAKQIFKYSWIHHTMVQAHNFLSTIMGHSYDHIRTNSTI